MRKPAAKQSKYVGVRWSSGEGKWCSSIQRRGQYRFLGYFDDEESAHAAYLKVEIEFGGPVVYPPRKDRRLYHIWNDMIRRCEDKKHIAFAGYGGEGVTVCEEWHVFQVFEIWAIEHGYAENLMIDRIKAEFGYRPGNVRFVERTSQNCNKRKARTIRNGERPSSRFKGVFWDKRRKHWIVKIQLNGKSKYVGQFTDEVEAARAYDHEAIRLHGEFALLNFPEEAKVGLTH